MSAAAKIASHRLSNWQVAAQAPCHFAIGIRFDNDAERNVLDKAELVANQCPGGIRVAVLLDLSRWHMHGCALAVRSRVNM